MDIELARFNMVEQQIRTWNVFDQGVLDALSEVRRERFVPAALRALAFADIEIPLGHGQVMLAPKIEAKVLQGLQIRRGEQVLEIGCGSGFMAALMAARGAQVRTLEIEPALAAQARINLERAGVDNVIVEEADGAAGCAAQAPFDLIVASGGIDSIPASWLAQLKTGGRVFAFVGEAPVMRAVLLHRQAGGEFREEGLFETVVPALRMAHVSHFVL